MLSRRRTAPLPEHVFGVEPAAALSRACSACALSPAARAGMMGSGVFMNIRAAGRTDRPLVIDVHRRAFPDEDVASLAEALFDDPDNLADLSLVACDGDTPVRHVMFSEARCGSARCVLLAPLGVVPEMQGHGVGSALVEEGLHRAAALGFELALVLGHPDYYPRFGFVPAGALGIVAPYEIEMPEAWMAVELAEGAAGRARGTVVVAEALRDEALWRE